ERVAAATARCRPVRYSDESSRGEWPTHGDGSSPCAPPPARITSSTLGEILHPQPAPWLYWVRRMVSDMGSPLKISIRCVILAPGGCRCPRGRMLGDDCGAALSSAAAREDGMGKRVALVLGSGGARGYAHIGVIDELEARGYQICCIAGCSMGAVVGGIHAAGKLAEYRAWIESLDYLDVLRLVDV